MPTRFRLLLVNRLGQALVAYPVDARSGRRTALARPIAPQGGRHEIDISGEPLAFSLEVAVSGGADPNGCYVGWDLYAEPALIQVKVLHYKVPPGAAGADLAKQPIVLAHECFETRAGPHILSVESGFKLEFR